MRRNPNETTTAISSDKVGKAILANPDAPPHKTSWEILMQHCDGQSNPLNPPLDALGRPRKDYKPEDDLKGDSEMAMATGELDNKETKVILIRDHGLEMPELHLKVHLQGPPEDTRGFPRLFARAACQKAKDIHDADLVVFTGGPDVNPAYYGEDPVPSYYGNDDRDYSDWEAYITAYDEGIPMAGVCRGAQFLAVMNNFKLVQDVNNHNGDHPMWLPDQSAFIDKISSVHHQQVIPGAGMEVLGYSQVSTSKWLNPKTCLTKDRLGMKYPKDVEAFFLRETCCFCVQGHPEYSGYNRFAQWFLEQLNEFIILNLDVDYTSLENGDLRRRLKPDLLALRPDHNKEVILKEEHNTPNISAMGE